MKLTIILTIFLLSFTIPALAQEEAPPAYPSFSLHGYYKNLVLNFTDPTTGINQTKDVNRLRLKLEGNFSESLSAAFHYEVKALPKMGFFTSSNLLTQDNVLNLDWTISDTLDYFVGHSLDRAFITYTAGETDTTVGRQRIAWGTGRVWNPTDLFNPFNPLEIDKEEKVGTDAINITHSSSATTRTSLVYGAKRTWSLSSLALRHQTTISDVDYAIILGKFKEDFVYGFDFAGNVWDAGIHGEAAYTQAKNEPYYLRWVLGGDYTFKNNLTLSAEYYFNGVGKSDPLQYQPARLLTGEITNLAKNYLFVGSRYEITPLWIWSNSFISNWDDGSIFYTPGLEYSYQENGVISAGAYFFGGPALSEYGSLPTLYYLRWAYYF